MTPEHTALVARLTERANRNRSMDRGHWEAMSPEGLMYRAEKCAIDSDAAAAVIRELSKDAERYRFLRIGGMAKLYCVRPDVGIMSGLPLDDAIDAALAAVTDSRE